MQEIWVCGLDWDDPLPEEISVKIMSWFAELPMLPKIRVPRCLDDPLPEEISVKIM